MKRDYPNHQPIVITLMNLKIFFDTQTAVKPKRQRIGDRVEMLIDGADKLSAAGVLVTWPDLLEIFITSSAVAGCSVVSFRPDGPTSGPETVAK